MRVALAAGLAALVLPAAGAASGGFVSLPSPVAPLSASPPLGIGATASSEGRRHRIAAHTHVVVSLGRDGTPFGIVATQRLDVRITGDYFFTIGAPLLDVVAAPGSASTPGLRATSIVWAGFDPGRRTLAARATLDASQAAPSLPLRVEVANGRTVLRNTTGAEVNVYTADATRPPLLAFLERLRADLNAGRPPLSGSAQATSKPVSTRLRVVVPLVVRGTIGGHAVNVTLRGSLVVPSTGAVRLTVTPDARVSFGDLGRLSGRQLLQLATRASLQAARTRQFETFLGNPDPVGSNETRYVYRTAARPTPPVAVAAKHGGHGVAATFAWLAALAAAAVAGIVAWTRA